jgi:Tol biopolymer transport system component
MSHLIKFSFVLGIVLLFLLKMVFWGCGQKSSNEPQSINDVFEGQITFVSDRNGILEIFLVNADGSNPILLASPNNEFCMSPSWSPTGLEFATTSYLTQQVNIFELNGNESNLYTFTDKYPSIVNWSPDGTHISVTTSPSIDQYHPTNLYIISVTSGEIITVVEDLQQIGQPCWSPSGEYLLYNERTYGRPGGEWPYSTLTIYSINSGKIYYLTDGNGLDGSGDWSPN